jgi:hypothetical protein
MATFLGAVLIAMFWPISLISALAVFAVGWLID